MERLETEPLGRGGGNWLGIELRKRQPEEIGLLSSNVSREAAHATSFESSLTPSWHPWPTGSKEPSWFSSNLIQCEICFRVQLFKNPLPVTGLPGKEDSRGKRQWQASFKSGSHIRTSTKQSTGAGDSVTKTVPWTGACAVAATRKHRCPREALSHPAVKGAMRKESSCSM